MSTIPTTMKAVVAYGPGDYRYEELPVPEPKGGDLLIKVEGCGVCGSDVKCYHGAEVYWGKDGKSGFVEGPVIPGHEFSGVVADMGPDAKAKGEFQVGDRVVAEMSRPCRECRFCKSGNYNMCVSGHIYGFKSIMNGAFAEYMIYPQGSIVHKIAKDLPLEKALLVEPFSCASHGVERGQITPDDLVVISGLGCIGLGMVGATKRYKPRMVVGLDMNPLRAELGKKFGCDLVLDPSKIDVDAEVRKLTDGYGCDVYIEAAAHPSSVVQGLKMLRNQGRFVEFSIFNEPVTVDWTIISDIKELTIYGSHHAPYCYERVIEGLTSGEICADGVVTHKYALADYKAALDKAAESTGVIKVILVP